MRKSDTNAETHYVMIDMHSSIVMPVEAGLELFKLLCRAEAVSYDWQTKTHKRADTSPTLRVFTLAEYAKMALESAD